MDRHGKITLGTFSTQQNYSARSVTNPRHPHSIPGVFHHPWREKKEYQQQSIKKVFVRLLEEIDSEQTLM